MRCLSKYQVVSSHVTKFLTLEILPQEMLEITNIQKNSAIFLLQCEVIVEQFVVESSRLHHSYHSYLSSPRNT